MLSEKDQIIISQVAVKATVELGVDPVGDINRFNDTAAALFDAIVALASMDIGAAPTSVPATPTVSAAPLAEAKARIDAAFPGAQTLEIGNTPIDRLWKSCLLDQPDQWWDNRTDKRNPKAPDFKAKNTANILNDKGDPVALWIDSKNTPAWVVEHLSATA